MSTTPTTVGIPAQRWSVTQYAILAALVLALMAGVFGVYALTSSEEAATTAPGPALVEDGRAGGGDGCSARLAVSGGIIEGSTKSDACGDAGGSGFVGGVQP